MERVEAARLGRDLGALDTLRAQLEAALERPDAPLAELHYDLAYLLWRSQLLLPDTEDRTPRQRQIPADARAHLDALLALEPAHLEGRVLEVAILGMEAVQSLFARVRLGRRANEVARATVEEAPGNPRARLQLGIMVFYTPALLGGGSERAIEHFERVREAFDARGQDEPWPNWGANDNLAFLGRALASSGRSEEARAVYEEALAREPGSRWIREELLPALDP